MARGSVAMDRMSFKSSWSSEKVRFKDAEGSAFGESPWMGCGSSGTAKEENREVERPATGGNEGGRPADEKSSPSSDGNGSDCWDEVFRGSDSGSTGGAESSTVVAGGCSSGTFSGSNGSATTSLSSSETTNFPCSSKLPFFVADPQISLSGGDPPEGFDDPPNTPVKYSLLLTLRI